MNKKFVQLTFGWGLLLWIIGYILGIILFFFVPVNLLGWFIMPIGILLTLWVLFKKIDSSSISDYLFLGLSWTLIALIGDYLFIIKFLNPADGYYKLDVYLYYIFTFVLPIIVGYYKTITDKK